MIQYILDSFNYFKDWSGTSSVTTTEKGNDDNEDENIENMIDDESQDTTNDINNSNSNSRSSLPEANGATTVSSASEHKDTVKNVSGKANNNNNIDDDDEGRYSDFDSNKSSNNSSSDEEDDDDDNERGRPRKGRAGSYDNDSYSHRRQSQDYGYDGNRRGQNFSNQRKPLIPMVNNSNMSMQGWPNPMLGNFGSQMMPGQNPLARTQPSLFFYVVLYLSNHFSFTFLFCLFCVCVYMCVTLKCSWRPCYNNNSNNNNNRT